MTENKLTIQEFWDSVKTKYPQYQNIDSVELGNKMLEKYPEYKSKIKTDINDMTLWWELITRAVETWWQLKKRWENIFERLSQPTTWDAWMQLAQTTARTVWFTWDVIWWAFDVIWQWLAFLTPDIVKDKLSDYWKQTWDQLSPQIQETITWAIKTWWDTYKKLKQANPDLFYMIEWGLNIWTAWIWTAWTKAVWTWVKSISQDIAKQTPKLVNKLPDVSPIKWTKQAVTRNIPESIVSWDLWFTPTERRKITNITWKSESQYILDKWLAWKWKEELAEYFAKQANDNYKWIDTKLAWLNDIPQSSKVTTEALEDILNQLTSSDKFKKAYAADIKAVEDMLARWKYTLLEKHRIRQSFDRVNSWMYTAQWRPKSWLDNEIDVKIRQWISNELQEWALKQWVDVKAMNNELRAWIEMKDALLRRLSQEEKNNFLWLQDIWVWAILSWWDPFTWLWLVASKKYLEWIAPSLSQKLYNLNKTKNETSRMRRGNPITNTNKSSELGLVTNTRSDLASKPLKKAEKPVKKETKKPKPLKPASKFTKAQKSWLSKNKSQAQKQINDLEKEIKTAKSKWLTAKVKELTAKLKVFVDWFIEWFKTKPKWLYWDITWWLATRVGQGIEWWIEKVKWDKWITWFHWTIADFDEFLDSKMWSWWGSFWGKWVYLTSNEDIAKQYAKGSDIKWWKPQVLTVKADWKVLDATKKISKEEIKETLNAIKDIIPEDTYSNLLKIDNIEWLFNNYQSLFEFIQPKVTKKMWLSMEDALNWVQQSLINKELSKKWYIWLKFSPDTIQDTKWMWWDNFIIFDSKKANIIKKNIIDEVNSKPLKKTTTRQGIEKGIEKVKDNVKIDWKEIDTWRVKPLLWWKYSKPDIDYETFINQDEFKKWFWNSIMTEWWQPKPYFHYSENKFDKFKTRQQLEKEWIDLWEYKDTDHGIYFTDETNKWMKEFYWDNVYTVFLKVDNIKFTRSDISTLSKSDIDDLINEWFDWIKSVDETVVFNPDQIKIFKLNWNIPKQIYEQANSKPLKKTK